jgi:hypothetical protein
MTLGTNLFLPNLAVSLVEKCRFLKKPESPDELDLAKGVTFEEGTFGDFVIKKLTVFPLVMHLDGANSTGEAQAALQGLLMWAKDEFGLKYSPSMVSRWAYVSDVVFQSDFPLLQRLNPILNRISEKITNIVLGNLKENLEYEPAKFWLTHDPSKRSAQIAPFTLEHRAMSLPEENLYYSEAPIPTEDHIALLRELEDSLR